MPASKKVVHVVVAVIENSEGKFLIAKRPQTAHQGGLWEFPGGKVGSNESPFAALERELFEEVDLQLLSASPLIQVPYDYGDRTVLLDVWKTDDFSGSATGKEGQEICWVDAKDFSAYEFPAANTAIISAIQLPEHYMITGDFADEHQLLSAISTSLKKNIRLIQFRAHHLTRAVYFNYAKKIYGLCQKHNAKLMLNCAAKDYLSYSASHFSDGIHLNTYELNAYVGLDCKKNIFLAASIHNAEELSLAHKRKMDFCVLSPVKKTSSHPDSIPLGWEKFNQLCATSILPVYALGGMNKEDLALSKKMGGQGISAISAFWPV